MSKNISNYELFKWFMIEEYRVLCDLFGKKRLAMFPIMLLIVSFLLGLGVPLFSFEGRIASAVLMSLIFLFGIQTGSLGFEARDMIDDLTGGSARILYSSRTLPITRSRLASIFLVKDALIYTFVMLIPIVSGTLMGIYFTPIDAVQNSISYTITDAIYLYVMSILSFVFGSSVGFVLTTSDAKNPKTILITVVGVLTAVATFTLVDTSFESLLEINPLIASVILLLGILLSSGIGVWQFSIVSSTQNKKSTYSNYYSYMPEFARDSVTLNIFAKSCVDISRSPGGFWKLIFSTGIIVTTIVFLVAVVQEFIRTMVMEEFLYVALLSLAVFPIYSIVYRYDSDKYYSIHPVSSSDVRRSKVMMYLIFSYVVIGSFYSILTYGTVSLMEYAFGLVLLPFLLVYQLGIFLAVAKDEPSKFLFDGALFGLYSVSMMIVVVPVVMVGLFGPLLPDLFVMSVVVMIVVSGLIGVVLSYVGIRGRFRRDS